MLTFSFPTSRAMTLALGTALVLALAGCNDSDKNKERAAATEANAPTMDISTPGELPDMSIGKADAPVTIVEYASMTCGHCANFSTVTLPYLKKKYIDTGKARLIFREFPLDPRAYAAALLARCAGPDKFFPMVEILFKQQSNWAMSERPEAALLEVAKQAGITQDKFNACLQDQDAYIKLQKERQRAAQKFGVDSTPVFFINGRIEKGDMSPEMLDKKLQPHLDAAAKK